MPGSFLEEDLEAIYATDEHAVAGTVNGTEVLGFFERGDARSLGRVSGANPMFRIRASDAAAAVGSTINIAGTAYTIRERRDPEDGGGGLEVLLDLEKS